MQTRTQGFEQRFIIVRFGAGGIEELHEGDEILVYGTRLRYRTLT